MPPPGLANFTWMGELRPSGMLPCRLCTIHVAAWTDAKRHSAAQKPWPVGLFSTFVEVISA